MKNIYRVLSMVLFVGSAAFAQTALTQTTTSAAALATDKIINVTSATGINAPSNTTTGSALFIVSPGNMRGELVLVQAVNSTAITVARGRSGQTTAIPSGARVIIGTPAQFGSYDPAGGCTAANTTATPFINVKNGLQWLCSSVTSSWVPGFGNTTAPAQPTTAVASAAGLVTPSGPLFHMTGALAVTGFNIPIGFVGSSITVIPDSTFTWTAANNIGVLGSAVAFKPITFTFDTATAKFYPSY